MGVTRELKHLAMQRPRILAMRLPFNRDSAFHEAQERGVAEMARQQHLQGGIQLHLPSIVRLHCQFRRVRLFASAALPSPFQRLRARLSWLAWR